MNHLYWDCQWKMTVNWDKNTTQSEQKEREAESTPLTHTCIYITTCSLSWLGTDNSIKSGRVKTSVMVPNPPLCEILRSWVFHMWIQFLPSYISGRAALWWSGIWLNNDYILKSVHVIQCISERIFISCNATIKVIIFD